MTTFITSVGFSIAKRIAVGRLIEGEPVADQRREQWRVALDDRHRLAELLARRSS